MEQAYTRSRQKKKALAAPGKGSTNTLLKMPVEKGKSNHGKRKETTGKDVSYGKPCRAPPFCPLARFPGGDSPGLAFSGLL